MTLILVAVIAMVLGAVMGLGIALKVFGVDTDCQRWIHRAYAEGWEAARERSVEHEGADAVGELYHGDNPYPSGDPRE